MNNLTARILTAVCLLPPVLAVVWFGGVSFLVLLGVVGLAIIWEWMNILDDRATSPLSAIYVMTLLGVLFHFYAGSGGLALQVFGLVGLGAAATSALAALHDKNKFLAGAGVLYLLLPFILLVDLRQGQEGQTAFLAFLSFVWISDMGAYATGRTIGGAKLAVKISQNKTWSGALGGVGWTMAAAAVWVQVMGLSPQLFFWAAGISIATQAGDLLESFIKRRFNIKDSSKLLPGHGGILDRVDGMLFAVLAVYGAAFFLGLGESSAAQILLGLL